MVNQNRLRRVQPAAPNMNRSPSLASETSKKSIRSSGYGAQNTKTEVTNKYNRVYSPSGRTRNGK